MDTLDQYDEFGNFLGTADEEEGGVGAAHAPVGEEWDGDGGGVDEDADDGVPAEDGDGGSPAAGGLSGAIVLHEDKKFYPDADEVYPDAEVLVEEVDAQPITQPIVAPVAAASFTALEESPPATVYSASFLTALMSAPARVRAVALVGHLHHGKTTLADLLIEATLTEKWDPRAAVRYTDARADEQERGISLKATPFSVVLPGCAGGPSHLLHAVDAPGHVNFSDEVCAALRLVDGVALVVDVVEGLLMGGERALRAALAEGAAVVLVLAKVDRLILELKLPPTDAYFKLLAVVAEVNEAIARATPAGVPPRFVTPLDGSVVFAGARHGWSFTLGTFATAYAERVGGGVDAGALAKRLWGDVWFNAATRRFQRASPAPLSPRAFVQFVLEPLYKVYATVVGEGPAELAAVLRELGVPPLKPATLRMDAAPLLKVVMGSWLGGAGGLADAFVAHIPSPLAAAGARVAAFYTGDGDAPEAAAMRHCDAAGPLMVNVTKLLSAPEGGNSFFALGRVWSGTVRPGTRVRVLGEGYSVEDTEDVQVAEVRGVSLGQARYRIELDGAPPGSLVLLEGLSDAVARSATITGSGGGGGGDVSPFRALAFNTTACMNVSVEPLNPAELPKVLAGLRALTKSYPLARTRVEESGEHVLVGTGELALDSMLRDLREMHARVEVKVADPVVSFSETVAEQSSLPCFALTPNKKSKLTMIAEPLEKGLAECLEGGAVDLAAWEPKRVTDYFSGAHGWDALSSRGVWAFGPSPERGGNVLVNDTLSTVDRRLLGAVRDSVVQGFQWGCREGPLCDEPIRGVKFRLVDAVVAGEPVQRGGGQVIPTARRAVYSSFLVAAPRLMEPVFAVEVLCPAEVVRAVHDCLAQRRGHVVSEVPRAGTPFVLIRGALPVMDSFGFETDLRVVTQGLAFGMSVFEQWAVVPGDPLDKAVVLRPLEPSPPHALARDFMIKSRRRKGLPEDVNPTRFFDSELLLALLAQEGGGAQ